MKSLRPSSILLATLLCTHLACPSLTGADATITLEPPDADPPGRVILSDGDWAELTFYRHLWQAMRVRTPAGREMDITDLFMYQTRVNGSGDYWTRPERWDSELSFQVGRTTADGAAVEITGERFPVLKTVSAAIYAGEPMVYVVSRMEALEEATIDSDTQLTHIGTSPQEMQTPLNIVIDGEDRSHLFDEELSIRADAFMYTYLPGEDVCLAILTVPRDDQFIKVRNPLYYRNRLGSGGDWARELGIRGIHEQELSPGEVIDLRYVIYWNDGDRIDEVKELAERLRSGELAIYFPDHLLPD